MTHAMVISGVHLDSAGKPVRYKVENSWGDAVGNKGYFVMSDAWFEQFVYQVVIPKALAPKELVKVFEGAERTVLPPWDPMVSGRCSLAWWCGRMLIWASRARWRDQEDGMYSYRGCTGIYTYVRHCRRRV